jgi:hypothetical protein
MRPDTQTRVAQCSSSVMEELMPFLLEEILMLEDRCFYATQFGGADVAAERFGYYTNGPRRRGAAMRCGLLHFRPLGNSIGRAEDGKGILAGALGAGGDRFPSG